MKSSRTLYGEHSFMIFGLYCPESGMYCVRSQVNAKPSKALVEINGNGICLYVMQEMIIWSDDSNALHCTEARRTFYHSTQLHENLL